MAVTITPRQINPSNGECFIKRSYSLGYDNGLTPGSSTNNCGSRSNFVSFTWDFEVVSWNVNGEVVGSGETLSDFTGWTPQLQGWSQFFNDNDPNSNANANFGFVSAPTWRYSEIKGCDPQASYGVMKLKRISDGCIFTVYPLFTETKYEEIIQCKVSEKNNLFKYFKFDVDENDYVEVERPDDWSCYRPKSFQWGSLVDPEAVSPCETLTYENLCDTGTDPDTLIVGVIDDCGDTRTVTYYTLDSWTNAQAPDELVEYTPVGDVQIIVDGVKEEFVLPETECDKFVVPVCVESQEWTYGIDNTGTNFSDIAGYELTLSDGTTLTWDQTPTTGWTLQLQQWSANIQQAADDAGLVWFVEPRFIDFYNVTNLDGTINGPGGTPSGLPGAPSEVVATALDAGGMRWRYVNFQICPGQPVPVSAKRLTSQNYGDNEYNLTAAGPVLGPVQKFEVCKKCTLCDPPEIEVTWFIYDNGTPRLASQGEIPNCSEPCGVLSTLPPPPNQACQFEFSEACDNNNSQLTTDFTNLVTRRSTVCNGERIAIDYFVPDDNDPAALTEYTLVGDFVDCDTGIILPEPVPECSEFEITKLFRLNDEGITRGLRRRTWLTGNTVQQTTDSSIPRQIIEDFDPDNQTVVSQTTVVSNVATLDDLNNAAAIQDLEILDGYIVVTEPTTVRWRTNSEGYMAVYLSECCGERKLLMDYSKLVGVTFTPEVEFPIGIHKIELHNLDIGGSNSNFTPQTRDATGAWVNDRDVLDFAYEDRKPLEECLTVKVCEDTGFIIDLIKNQTVEPETVYSCSLQCVQPISEKCSYKPTGDCRCYGSGGGQTTRYENSDNTTDIGFSFNSTSLKFPISQQPPEPDAQALQDAIIECINSGEIANISWVDTSGAQYTFAADTVGQTGPDYFYTGTSSIGSASGKVGSWAEVTCGDVSSQQKACSFYDCSSDSMIWLDSMSAQILSSDEITTLIECPTASEEECDTFNVQSVLCATEDVTNVTTGDELLKITTIDCNDVVISSKIYNTSNNNIEIVDPVGTEACDPEPDVEVVRSCVRDVNGSQWTEISIIDPSDLSQITTLYYNTDLELGEPFGDPEKWTNCADYESFDDVKLCEIDARYLLLIDSTGRFARYSFLKEEWENVSTLSVSSAGGSTDVENFLLYNFVAPDQMTVIDVNTDTQLPNITLTAGIAGPAGTVPLTFSAASFRNSDGKLYAQDTGGADAGLYCVNIQTGVVDFVTSIAGVSGSGTSIMIDNSTDTLIVNGSNLSYTVDWDTGVATLWGDPPIQPNGGTFDDEGNAYVTSGNNTYCLKSGLDPNDSNNWVRIIDDWTPGANSIAFYRVKAPKPSCFKRRYGVLTDGTRECLGDFQIGTKFDTPRTIVGEVVCCEEISISSDPSDGNSSFQCATPETQSIETGDGSVPAGLKSVTINNINGTTVIAGGFELGAGRRVDSISMNATNHPCINGLLPAINITGGTWQWIGIR